MSEWGYAEERAVFDGVSVALSEMTRHQLAIFKAETQKEIVAIKARKGRMEIARKAGHRKGPQGGKHTWFALCEAELELKRRVACIDAQIVVTPREPKQVRLIGAYFVDVAREALSQDVFTRLLEMATERRESDVLTNDDDAA